MTGPEHPLRVEARANLAELETDLRERLLALDEPVARDDWQDVVKRSRTERSWAGRLVPLVAAAVGAIAVGAVAALLLGVPSGGGRPAAVTAPPTLRQAGHLLYVTASQGGGFCYRWSGVSDGCDQVTSAPLSVSWSAGEVVGTVSSHRISSVRIAFTDGSEARVGVSWIDAPVDVGFFLFSIPPGKTVAAVSGLSGRRPARRVTWFSV